MVSHHSEIGLHLQTAEVLVEPLHDISLDLLCYKLLVSCKSVHPSVVVLKLGFEAVLDDANVVQPCKQHVEIVHHRVPTSLLIIIAARHFIEQNLCLL